jgi:hypothetical protein
MINSDLSSNTDRVLSLRLRVGGSDLTSGIYSNQSLGLTPTNIATNSANYTQTSAILQTNAYYSNIGFTCSLDIAQPFLTNKTNLFGESFGGSGSVPFGLNINCNVDNTVSYTGFTLLNSAGNFTSGTVSVYGYNK